MSENISMFADERKNFIVNFINKNHKVRVNTLCELLKVSPATIRSDLRELEKNDLLKRTHGGAISNSKTAYELELVQKAQENLTEKTAIGFVNDRDSISVDTGTTTFEFVKLLGQKNDLTVVTNDLGIATYLENNSNSKIILTGGVIRNGYNCLGGPLAVNSIETINVDKAFIGTSGLCIGKGATTPSLEIIGIKKKLMEIANEVILLCSSDKVGKVSLASFASLDDFDTIITDDGINNEKIDELRLADIDIVIAETKDI